MKRFAIAALVLVACIVFAENELSWKTSLNFQKGGATAARNESGRADVSGTTYASGVQTITTNGWQTLNIDTNDIPNSGWVWLKQLTSSNYVDIAYVGAATNVFGRIKPTEAPAFRLGCSIANIGFLAVTNSVSVEYLLVSD